MGIELESYADQTREEWMPGAILINKFHHHLPKPMREVYLDIEMQQIKELEDSGELPLDKIALIDRAMRERRARRNKDDQRKNELFD